MSEKQPITYRRAATLERSAVDLEARTIELTFSSESPVRRRYGNEVLDHSPSSARMQRLNDGGPALWHHQSEKQDALLGVVERAWIGDDRRGHAVVRMGRSAEAERALQDAADGILRNVSFGYTLHDQPKGERGGDGVDTYRFKDWEPNEVSFLPIPADHSIGVAREFEPVAEEVNTPAPAETKKEIRMAEITTEHNEAVRAERERVSEINALGQRYGQFLTSEQREKFVNDSTSVDQVRKHIMDSQVDHAKRNEVCNLNPLGLSDKEKSRFSITAAIRQSCGEMQDGFEMEVSNALAKKTGRDVRQNGILVPMDLPMAAGDLDRVARENGRQLATRSLDTSASNGNAAATIFTEYVNLIDLLRNQMKVRQMGATVMAGLSGTLAFPKQVGAASSYWVADNPGTDVADSALSFAQMTMSPKILQSSSGFSRLLLQQSSVDVEALVRLDLMAVNALAKDLAALTGTGANNQPKGILNQTGIGSYVTTGNSLSAAANGTNYGYDMLNEMETQIAEANADVLGTMGYLTTPRVRKKLKVTPELANTIALPIWQGGQANGYRAEVTNQLPKPNSTGGTVYAQHTLIGGIWSELMIGSWVAFEIITDPYRLKKQGIIEVTTFDTCDINVRHAQAFSACTDINPAL